MPELPDIEIYVEQLSKRIGGATLAAIRLSSPFVLRSIEPRPAALSNRSVVSVRRLGKRVVIEVEEELFVVIHLMIAGRLRWAARLAKMPARVGLAAFDFSTGTLLLTEASTRKRASIHLVAGETMLATMHRGGVEPLEVNFDSFRDALLRENHTLKRALTDPRIFSGIGNAYSDEILHQARLSPVRLTQRLDGDEIERLHAAVRRTLLDWTARLRSQAGDEWPLKVTAFREEMAVHGRYGKPCPVCKATVQRIVHASNETNYCPSCQTGGKLLADRALSRFLKADWPKTTEELEELKETKRAVP
ncbi:MAG: Fpg/Nei family DNA glycosylase [Polyangiales bacterium]